MATQWLPIFGILEPDMAPVFEVLDAFDPPRDRRQVDTWCFLFLVAGLHAGQHTRTPRHPRATPWQWQILSGLEPAPSLLELEHHPLTIQAQQEVMELARITRSWPTDAAAAAQIRAAHSANGARAPEEKGPLFQLLCLMNRLSHPGQSRLGRLESLRRWACASDIGWASAFFAVGVLLSADRDFHWEDMTGVYVATLDDDAKMRVEALIQDYVGRTPASQSWRQKMRRNSRRLALNPFELLTCDLVSVAAMHHRGRAHLKVGLKDALDIDALPRGLKEYAKKAHFDVVVTDSTTQTLFAVEFDESYHLTDRDAIRRDAMKNEICALSGFPLLRVNDEVLFRWVDGYPLLGWLVDLFFVHDGFRVAQERGAIAGDHPFNWQNLPFVTRRLNGSAVDFLFERSYSLLRMTRAETGWTRDSLEVRCRDIPEMGITEAHARIRDLPDIAAMVRIRSFRDFAGGSSERLAKILATVDLVAKLSDEGRISPMARVLTPAVWQP